MRSSCALSKTQIVPHGFWEDCLNAKSQRGARGVQKLNSTGTLIQSTTTEAPQRDMYYIGLDVHKKTISYCIKAASGQCRGKVCSSPGDDSEARPTRQQRASLPSICRNYPP